ncbi:hypothetical protein ACEZ3G_12220 [Maribacter algicola]|uniref:Uncharacterized protein n=1 Tax=Meishania litoralis TaxID=3434685 RepID=A0ACC7LKG7_9FLAO
MKKTIDLFSAQAKLYKKYRPHYPEEFFNEILGLVKNRSGCWDCGTGNGHFYRETIGPYWNEQRRHIDSKYETIDFPFDEIELSKPYHIEALMNLSQLEGYFNTWSSVQNYKKKNRENSVGDLIKELKKYWGNQSSAKTITFPMFSKIGIVKK